MHRLKLELDDDYTFLLYGVSCHLKDYRVAWYLNKQLKLDLIRSEVNLKTGKGDLHPFSLYKSKDEDNHLTFYLLDNYSEDFPLIKQLKQYDFFVIVEGYIDLFDKVDFIERLSRTENFQLVTEEDASVLSKHQFSLFES